MKNGEGEAPFDSHSLAITGLTFVSCGHYLSEIGGQEQHTVGFTVGTTISANCLFSVGGTSY